VHVCGIRLEVGGTECFFYPVSDLLALLRSRPAPAVAFLTTVAEGLCNFLFKYMHLNTSQRLTVMNLWKSEALQAAVTMALRVPFRKCLSGPGFVVSRSHFEKRCARWQWC
jgi:hypothetical protein